MLEITFKNDYGTVKIAGEGGLLDLIETSGLALPEAETEKAEFYNVPGQRVVALRDKARIITFSGDLAGSLSDASPVFYREGILKIVTDRISRQIKARCIKLSDRSEGGKIIIKFECDTPYFSEPERMETSVYNRIKLVETPFTLPCVFSQRILEGVVENLGMVESEPDIIVENYGSLQNGFKITNITTGKSFQLNVPIETGDKITISVPQRKVFNSRGENLLYGISDNSYIRDMVLCAGTNVLKFTGQGDMRCTVLYNSNFTEAVI